MMFVISILLRFVMDQNERSALVWQWRDAQELLATDGTLALASLPAIVTVLKRTRSNWIEAGLEQTAHVELVTAAHRSADRVGVIVQWIRADGTLVVVAIGSAIVLLTALQVCSCT